MLITYILDKGIFDIIFIVTSIIELFLFRILKNTVDETNFKVHAKTVPNISQFASPLCFFENT